nr:14 kDa proline-rich protein DC2.15-like [Ipomoea batatas]
MATKTIFTLSLLLLATLTTACGTCTPKLPPKMPPVNPYCPRDTLKLGVCANLLGGLVSIELGHAPTSPCCTLLAGLADLEVAACLCTALKANVLGINLEVPVALSALVSACQKTVPTGFKSFEMLETTIFTWDNSLASLGVAVERDAIDIFFLANSF